MYLDHEGNHKGDISPVEVNRTRVSTPHNRGATHAKVPDSFMIQIRILFCILMTILSLIFHGTGCTANTIWGDIFECCFKAQSSKLEGLFSLKCGKRDIRALRFDSELSKMSPQVGLAVHLDFKFICCTKRMILYRDVTSYKELWEGNWKVIRERGGWFRKKLRIASESEKVFARIFDEFFMCSGLLKTRIF